MLLILSFIAAGDQIKPPESMGYFRVADIIRHADPEEYLAGVPLPGIQVSSGDSVLTLCSEAIQQVIIGECF